jgi:hypothetical protein
MWALCLLLAACTPAVALEPVVTGEPAPTAAVEPTATLEPPAAPAPTASPAPTPAAPQACIVPGQQTYTQERYCFAYPADFTLEEHKESGVTILYGQALDEGPDPVRVSMGVSMQRVPPGSNLARLVDDFRSQNYLQGLPWEIVRTAHVLGGEPAESLDDLPGRLSYRQVMAIHGEILYTLIFNPSDNPAAHADLERLFETVMGSFTFLEGAAQPLPDPGPQVVSWFEFEHRFTLTYDPSLALWSEPWTTAAVPLGPEVMFADSHPSYAQFRFLGLRGGMVYQLPYPLRAAEVMVFRTADFTSYDQDLPTDFLGQQEALSGLLRDGLDPQACAHSMVEVEVETPFLLPFLPWVHSKQLLCAQPLEIEFSGGRGIRYLTHFTPAPGPVLEGTVFYTFQGLTEDGQFYVSAVFPVMTGIFPINPPVDYPGCIDPATAGDCAALLAEGLAKLGAQPGSTFDPTLETLDALVRSIRIEGP